MRFSEWEPLYSEICKDFGFSPDSDDMAVRLLCSLTLNSDLQDMDILSGSMTDTVSVIGDSPGLENDLSYHEPEGCILCSGSAVGRLMSAGHQPDIVVTDLDGDIEPQLKASASGALTLLLAHADNCDLLREYAPMFKGPIILTTQGRPIGNVFCFGGFTDGDRAVCVAREFGSQRILLYGFDFEHPNPKIGSDPETKLCKLSWARRIIFSEGGKDIIDISQRPTIGQHISNTEAAL